MSALSSQSNPQTPGRLAVSPSDAAYLAGIGRTKLYEALNSGSLPSFKIGARRLISMSALRAWIEAKEAGQ